MQHPIRPRRSVLYMPGSNRRALEKARELDADGLILDLEDAVSPDAKELARDQVMAAVRAGGYAHRELAIRVNGLNTPWGEADLSAAATSGADAVLLPKVESAAQVLQAESILEEAGAPEELGLWCMMETPRGILHAEEIADSTPRLRVLVMGTSDLTFDLHAEHTALRLPVLTSLSICLLAGRAAGLGVLDGVHLNLSDDEGFAAACRQGRELGFDGKTVIHPKQLEAANRIFAPSETEVAWSRRVIAAFETALEAGHGVVLLDGRLIENLHVEHAERVVALAEAITSRG